MMCDFYSDIHLFKPDDSMIHLRLLTASNINVYSFTRDSNCYFYSERAYNL